MRNFDSLVLWIALTGTWLGGTSFAPPKKTTPQEYIEKYSDWAIEEMRRSGVPASITLAQGMIESGNGNSSLAVEANNHFGIKCHKEWDGPSVTLDDDAPNECFRKYESAYDSFKDHSDFLRTRDRYVFLFDIPTTDYKEWAHGLKKAGYATNPNYAQLLINLIETHNLTRFDELVDNTMLETDEFGVKKTTTRRKRIDDFIIDLNKTHAVQYNNGVRYVEVRPGDTFESISEEFGMKTWEIYRYNDLPTGASIKYHKYLYIQSKRNKAHPKHKTHTMRENETLFAVAHKYGVKLNKLYKYNHIKKGTEPETGQTIQLRGRVK
ncbi:MAG: glucosaminidase domain-containing protein [Breznakibacter sp.]